MEITSGLLPGRITLNEVKNGIIQQYIGKKDIHDKEIYEGDIVECYKWFDGTESRPDKKSRYTVFSCLDSNLHEYSEGGYDGIDRVEEIEIVGNIYET